MGIEYVEEEEEEDGEGTHHNATSNISYFDAKQGGEQLLNVHEKQNMTLDQIEKYRFRMIEAFPDPTCVCDEDGNIIVSNARFQEQVDPTGNLTGKNLIKSIIFEEDQERIMALMEEVKTSPQSRATDNVGKLRTYTRREDNRRSSCQLLNFNWTISKDDSIVYGCVGSDGIRKEKCALLLIGRLVSQIHNTKAELREAIDLISIEELKKAAEEKERLIRRLVHELRTPLHLASSLMADVTKSSEGQVGTKDSSCHLAEKQIMNLMGTVEDLAVVMSDALGESVVPNLNQVEIIDLVDSLIDSLCDEYHPKRFEIIVNYKNLPKYLYADRRLLSRLYHHLIGNSLKYVPDGGVVDVCIEISKFQFEGNPKFSFLRVPQ